MTTIIVAINDLLCQIFPRFNVVRCEAVAILKKYVKIVTINGVNCQSLKYAS